MALAFIYPDSRGISLPIRQKVWRWWWIYQSIWTGESILDCDVYCILTRLGWYFLVVKT